MAINFDLVDFRMFVNVVEARSLTRGAERSFLSVPAISNRLKNLEEMLGIRLLDRSPQGISLTDAGRTYLRHARSVLAQLDLLTGELQEFTAGLKGRLRILANTTAVSEYLPAVMSAFLRSHPDVHIDLREKLSDEIVRSVRDGVADLGVISGSVVTDGLEVMPFVSSRLVVVAPVGHPVLKEEEVRFEDLLDYGIVSLLEGAAIKMFLDRICAALHRSMNVRIQVASYDATFRMVEAGAGIAIVPSSCYERLKDTTAIGVCRLSDPWADRQFALCSVDFDRLPLFAKDFAGQLVDHYRA